MGQIIVERLSSFGAKNALPLYRLVHQKVCPLSEVPLYSKEKVAVLPRLGRDVHKIIYSSSCLCIKFTSTKIDFARTLIIDQTSE